MIVMNPDPHSIQSYDERFGCVPMCATEPTAQQRMNDLGWTVLTGAASAFGAYLFAQLIHSRR
jgi:hypothetical protein